MGRFEGRVVVITGAARGIGFGCATRFTEERARVAGITTQNREAAGQAWRCSSPGIDPTSRDRGGAARILNS